MLTTVTLVSSGTLCSLTMEVHAAEVEAVEGHAPLSPLPSSSTPSVSLAAGCLKFRIQEDLALLRQVVSEEGIFETPVTSGHWLRVAENLAEACPRMRGIKPRAAKERAEKLVKQHRTKDNWLARQ